MSRSYWIFWRLLPALLVAAICALLLGQIRGRAVYLVGIQGLFFGFPLGWTLGWWARRDPESAWPFGRRLALVMATSLLFALVEVVVTASLRAPGEPLGEWVGDILDGYAEEPFLSADRFSTRSGVLSGPFWVIFNLLDTLLLAFTSLLGFGIALRPDRPGDRFEGE